MSVDPLTKKYPELTPYQFASNKPIWAMDLDGLEAAIYTRYKRIDGSIAINVMRDVKPERHGWFEHSYNVKIPDKGFVVVDYDEKTQKGTFVGSDPNYKNSSKPYKQYEPTFLDGLQSSMRGNADDPYEGQEGFKKAVPLMVGTVTAIVTGGMSAAGYGVGSFLLGKWVAKSSIDAIQQASTKGSFMNVDVPSAIVSGSDLPNSAKDFSKSFIKWNVNDIVNLQLPKVPTTKEALDASIKEFFIRRTLSNLDYLKGGSDPMPIQNQVIDYTKKITTEQVK